MSRLFLKPASAGLYHHQYDPISVLSMDFGKPCVSRIIECVPSDHFTNISGSVDLQLAPQIYPPYGRVYFRSASFFVPDHQVFSPAEAFHNNQNTYKGKAFKWPKIELYSFMNENLSFYASVVATITASVTHTDPATDYPPFDTYDFITYDNNSGDVDLTFYKLTEEGSRYYAFFKSLGYDFVSVPYPWAFTPGSGETRYQMMNAWCKYYRSALPLISYAKVYVDYFIPGQYFNGSEMVKILQYIHDNQSYTASGTTWFDSSTGVVAPEFAVFVSDNCHTPVVQDMYTSAWNYPSSPVSASSTEYGVANNGSLISPYIDQSYTYGTDTVNNSAFLGTRTQNHNGLSLTNISSFGLNILDSFFKFTRRNLLVGTRPVQRTLARFGIKPTDATSHFVSKLYEGSELIKFHPVLSNAANQSSGTTIPGEGIGDIAGFSKSSFNFSFEYKSSDYGMIIIVHWLQIKPILLHGQDPSTLRLEPFDHFTPEYDGEAIRPIPLCEISVLKDRRNLASVTSDSSQDSHIFGFTNIYDDYRTLRDNVIGDFVSGQAKDFLFARDYSVLRSNGANFKPQLGDVQYMSGGGYTNPFQMSDVIGDRFWLGIQFDITAERPIRTTSDALMLNGSGDTQVPLNGNIQS